jgi:hypothetical protein
MTDDSAIDAGLATFADRPKSSSLPPKWMSADGRTCHLLFFGNDCFSVRTVRFK